MRIESSVTAISWIPSDAIEGMPKLPFELGVARYDAPPPDHLEEGDLERLRAEDRFREANRLAALIEVEDGKIVGHGYEGTGLVGSTTFSLGITDITIPGRRLRGSAARAGGAGRTASASCRRSAAGPGSRLRAGWSGGRSSGSSRRPPGRRSRSRSEPTAPRSTSSSERARSPGTGSTTANGDLAAKSGTIDFKAWYREAHGERTPWGDEESDAFVTAAESALEREISRELMAGKLIPERRTLEPDETLVEQGRARRRALPRSRRRARRGRSTARRSPRSGLARSSARRRSSRAAREQRPSARGRAAASR